MSSVHDTTLRRRAAGVWSAGLLIPRVEMTMALRSDDSLTLSMFRGDVDGVEWGEEETRRDGWEMK